MLLAEGLVDIAGEFDVEEHNIRPVDAGEHVQQGRFPGSGRAHDGDVFAAGDGKVEPAQRTHLAFAKAKDALDAGQGDERRAHHLPGPCAVFLSSAR